MSILSYVGIKFDDETQALLLLSSLPGSWSGTINVVGPGQLMFLQVMWGLVDLHLGGIRDLVLGEDIRRTNLGGSSSSNLLHVGKGRGNAMDSGSKGRGSSKPRKNVMCWICNETGHVKSECPNKKKELNIVVVENNIVGCF